MKKILNDPADYVDEMLEGMIAAHPEIYAQPEPRVIARAGGAKAGKVGIVTGGGSGHLPVFTGYVGTGLLDAAAIGDVFASPSAEQMASAMRQAHGGVGILRILSGGQHSRGDGAIDHAGVEMGEAQRRGQAPGKCALAGGGRSVDRYDHKTFPGAVKCAPRPVSCVWKAG